MGSSAWWELGHRSGLTEHSAGGHDPTLEYLCQIPGEPGKVFIWREGQRGTPRALSQNSYVAAGGKVNCGGDWKQGPREGELGQQEPLLSGLCVPPASWEVLSKAGSPSCVSGFHQQRPSARATGETLWKELS